jgi:hypothetical protein
VPRAERCAAARLARLSAALLIVACAAAPAAQGARGQAPPGPGGPPPGGRGGAPPTPRAAAPVDLTGYWVAVVTEDWRWRMLTPARGDFAGLPLNAAARELGLSWDPARDQKAGQQCRAYGAPAIMRIPGRVHITWQDDRTLKIDTDAGTQTRLLRFGAAGPPGPPSWQGHSVAQWEGPMRGPGPPDFLPIALNPRVGTRGRALEVVTTNLRPGYLRKNGAPYSDRTVLREYFDVFTVGETPWFTVTTIVEDPAYLTTPYVTSSNFRKEPDGSRWAPGAC